MTGDHSRIDGSGRRVTGRPGVAHDGIPHVVATDLDGSTRTRDARGLNITDDQWNGSRRARKHHVDPIIRSEERRVGKESTSQIWIDSGKKRRMERRVVTTLFVDGLNIRVGVLDDIC